MCKKNSLLTRPMSRKMYSTYEINQAHEQVMNCRDCSNKERTNCQKSFSRTNIPTNSNKLPERKQKNSPFTKIVGSNLHGKILRKHGFKVELTGKTVQNREQFKVIPIIYGRTKDRFKEMIHE